LNTLTVATTLQTTIGYSYLLAAVLFIVGLKMLGQVKTAARGNLISAVGMLIASVATLFLINHEAMPGQSYMVSLLWIGGAVAVGAAAGLGLGLKLPMTSMPQMVALLNGFGGVASLLVACSNYLGTAQPEQVSTHVLLATGLTVLVGGITFTGSLIAFAKLQGLVTGNPILFPMQKAINLLLLIAAVAMVGLLIYQPDQASILAIAVVLALVLGMLLVIPIGGADMPVVISLLNSYSGLAAAMAGFVLGNMALIITGALVGASGIILTNIMCKAMNRSLTNVLFGGVGAVVGGSGGGSGSASGKAKGAVREFTIEDAAIVLDAARQVIIVPGYGLAVAQAQHSVKELADALEGRGVTVKYAIHPVAGRMPGHMNVLLAEANVPYEQLYDLETINPDFEQTDVALVIGANDVTNPAARHAQDSPIYGMPILDVDKARTVFVIKRSLNPGFAGIENELYYAPNCGMIFGDAKKVVNNLVAQLHDSE